MATQTLSKRINATLAKQAAHHKAYFLLEEIPCLDECLGEPGCSFCAELRASIKRTAATIERCDNELRDLIAEIKFRPMPTPEQIRTDKQTRFDVVAPGGDVLKFLVTRRDPDENHMEPAWFLASLQPKFTYMGKLEPSDGLYRPPDLLPFPPSDPRMLVVTRALGVIYGRKTLPAGYIIRGAKIEPPKKKRTKKERKDAEPRDGTGRDEENTAPHRQGS